MFDVIRGGNKLNCVEWKSFAVLVMEIVDQYKKEKKQEEEFVVMGNEKKLLVVLKLRLKGAYGSY